MTSNGHRINRSVHHAETLDTFDPEICVNYFPHGTGAVRMISGPIYIVVDMLAIMYNKSHHRRDETGIKCRSGFPSDRPTQS